MHTPIEKHIADIDSALKTAGIMKEATVCLCVYVC